MRQKPLIVTGIFALGLGMILSVGAAWGAAILGADTRFNDWDRVSLFRDPATNCFWESGADTGYSYLRVFAERDDESDFEQRQLPGWTNVMSVIAVEKRRDKQDSNVVEKIFGWPLPAMSYTIVGIGEDGQSRNAIHLYTDMNYWMLPIRPIWDQLLVNTLIYATISMCAMIIAKRLWVALRRLGIGDDRCEVCGYSLHQLPSRRCPECGKRGN